VAAASSRETRPVDDDLFLSSVDEYPATVQELVMNGFSLQNVVRAFELIGDSFDDLLAFLMMNAENLD
jgi:hypothetical protein